MITKRGNFYWYEQNGDAFDGSDCVGFENDERGLWEVVMPPQPVTVTITKECFFNYGLFNNGKPLVISGKDYFVMHYRKRGHRYISLRPISSQKFIKLRKVNNNPTILFKNER